MRLDKFLWSVRKYKTRSLATEAVRKNRVGMNQEEAKPSRTVRPGDYITYKKEGVTYRIKVLDLPKSRVGAKLVEQFVEDKTEKEELEKQDFMRMMHNFNRKKGLGRPTKKDRRDLDDFKDG
ncbi:MAG: S4 domain-containing protein [Owenweeksia sp.]|nr:S4 domain-containing protein [Owenweeksia sp.]